MKLLLESRSDSLDLPQKGSSERQHCALIISYDFPELSGAGVIRTYQFAKMLPQFGWRAVILTAQPCGVRRWEVSDDVEFSDGQLPCPKITAPAWEFPPPFGIRGPAARMSQNEKNRKSSSFGNRLARFASQFAVPDGKIGWLNPAVKRGAQIARSHPYQVCFSVSPRPTAHLVAYRLARRFNIPWVADFALPWSDAYWLAGRPRMIEQLDRKLEGLIVRSAQHITVAYAELARSLLSRHGGALEKKITVIPTGFQEELFTGQIQVAAKFTVVYPGNHFCEPGRHGEYFLRAIDNWIASDPSLARKVEFLFIGKRDDDLLRQRAAMAHPKVVRIEPLVSHRACIQAIRSSHACVVNTVGNRIPAKVYECMRAGKWILALTEPASDLATLIRDYPKGLSVPPQDLCGIRHALRSILQQSASNQSESMGVEPIVDRYSCSHSAERLCHIFKRLLATSSGTVEFLNASDHDK
jgi:Glycosyl transferase 4-like domain/Glycosyl transferases group 1